MVPERAWRRSEPPDPGSSGCRAGVLHPPASGSSPAAPAPAGTSSRRGPRAGPPATPPDPTLRSPRRSPRPRPARPHLRGPPHKRGEECLLDESCRRAGRSGRRAPPSPYDTASSEGSGSFQVLQGSSPITFPSPSSKAHQKSGSFPPPELPGINGHTTLSDSRTVRCHKQRRSRDLRPHGSPPITRITLPACRVHYPGGPDRCICRLLPCPHGLPRIGAGSASALLLSRPAQTSLALQPAESLNHPRVAFVTGFDPTGCPAKSLVSYQINRQVSGWNLPPLVTRAFGAHPKIPHSS